MLFDTHPPLLSARFQAFPSPNTSSRSKTLIYLHLPSSHCPNMASQTQEEASDGVDITLVCLLCTMTFSRRADLARHLKLHTRGEE